MCFFLLHFAFFYIDGNLINAFHFTHYLSFWALLEGFAGWKRLGVRIERQWIWWWEKGSRDTINSSWWLQHFFPPFADTLIKYWQKDGSWYIKFNYNKKCSLVYRRNLPINHIWEFSRAKYQKMRSRLFSFSRQMLIERHFRRVFRWNCFLVGWMLNLVNKLPTWDDQKKKKRRK